MVWLGQADHLTRQIDYYREEESKPFKMLLVEDIRQVGERLYPHRFTMTNQQDNTTTSQIITRIQFGADIPSTIFDPRNLERQEGGNMQRPDALTALAAGVPFETFVSQTRWLLVGAEFAGELVGLGIHGEGGYAFVSDSQDTNSLTEEDHLRLLLGMDYTFGFQLSWMVEYIHLGRGRSERSHITLNDRMAYPSGEILSTNRDTLFAGFGYPVTDFVDASLYGIAALSDPSVIVNPWLEYSVCEGVKFSVTAYIPVNLDDSQNGDAGPSGFGRLKFSF